MQIIVVVSKQLIMLSRTSVWLEFVSVVIYTSQIGWQLSVSFVMGCKSCTVSAAVGVVYSPNLVRWALTGAWDWVGLALAGSSNVLLVRFEVKHICDRSLTGRSTSYLAVLPCTARRRRSTTLQCKSRNCCTGRPPPAKCLLY